MNYVSIGEKMPEFFSFDYVKEQFPGEITGVVHIGAHYAEEAWEYDALGWKALWFEAHPEYAKKMRENLNYYKDQYGFEVCLSDTDGEQVEFWTTADEYASSMLKPKLHQQQNPHAFINGKIELTTIRFDTLWNTFGALHPEIPLSDYNLLVLDVQGAETKVFKGMGNYIKNFKGIISEYSTVEFYEDVPQLTDLDQLYGEFDFVRVFPQQDQILWHADALYVLK